MRTFLGKQAACDSLGLANWGTCGPTADDSGSKWQQQLGESQLSSCWFYFGIRCFARESGSTSQVEALGSTWKHWRRRWLRWQQQACHQSLTVHFFQYYFHQEGVNLHYYARNKCFQQKGAANDDENPTYARAPARCPSLSLTSPSVPFSLTPVWSCRLTFGDFFGSGRAKVGLGLAALACFTPRHSSPPSAHCRSRQRGRRLQVSAIPAGRATRATLGTDTALRVRPGH